MCGITGFIDHTHRVTEADLERASKAVSHRGGNGNGFIYDKKEHYIVGLANERLAIIDLGQKAQQPLTSSCGKYTITINGTIYNYVELRETLIKYGVIFTTLSDTEVILESYKKWGISAFEKLDGSYSFILFDRKLNQLLVARDELGAKPLYYFKTKGFYACCSEIRGLLCLPPVVKAINRDAIAGFFRYGYFKGEQTIYKDIFKHKKGILTTIDLHSGNSYDMPLIRRKPETPCIVTQTETEILYKIEEHLTDSILKRSLADVPIGALLSGGYDSATVAAILQKNQSKKIKTFTVGFQDDITNEAPQARKIAEHLKTNHQDFYLDSATVLQIVEELPEISDEPLGDSSAIPLIFMAEKVKKEVKVLLGAEGGDELFGGYRTYAKAINLDHLSKKKLPKVMKSTIKTVLSAVRPKMADILAADGLLNKYLEVNACFALKELERLLTDQPILPKDHKSKAETIKGLLIYDLHNYLPHNNLFKSDKCFMHHGVENRDALLKMELIHYLTTLDPEWFIKDGQQKYLLKKITAKYVPASLMKAPKKGFEVPLTSWLKTTLKPLIEHYLSPQLLGIHELFNTSEVAKIKAAFYMNSNTYNAQKIWLLLQFQMWYIRWMV